MERQLLLLPSAGCSRPCKDRRRWQRFRRHAHRHDIVFLFDDKNTFANFSNSFSEREARWQEKPISMESCMNCHREKNASNVCNFCHESH